MTRNAKTTDPKPAVTMDANGDVYLDDWWIGHIYPDHRIEVRAVFTATEFRAAADFLDQLEGADLLSQVTP